jgi:hypothetical protein
MHQGYIHCCDECEWIPPFVLGMPKCGLKKSPAHFIKFDLIHGMILDICWETII